MKIRRIKINEIEHRPLLNGLELRFQGFEENYVNANCFIGVNGSGKSQLLETIAEIFFYIDQFYRRKNRIIVSVAPLLFEIEYTVNISNKDYVVKITQENRKGKAPAVTVLNPDKEEVELTVDDVEKYLPQKVVGYTSGENETISIPFHSYYDIYADYVANKALKGSKDEDYEPRFYFMDYNANLGIAISNLIFEESPGIEYLKEELKIKQLKSFQIILQTNQAAAPKVKSVTGEVGIILTKELYKWRDFLIKSATCYDYDDKLKKFTFDFYVNKASRAAIKHFFVTAYKFYTALYKFEILNNLIIDKATRDHIRKQREERKLNTKLPAVPDKDKVLRYSELKVELINNQIIDYLSFSDGEHQYFNIFGTMLMIGHNNSLFLLDEPETHFNPRWRRLFISNLKKLIQPRRQDLFITSHSPFIVSDLKKEFIYIFERASQNSITVKYPDQETFGSSFENILKMAFGLDEIISEEASAKINKLRKETNPEVIEEGIKHLGESSKLMALYRRIEMLNDRNK